MTGAQCLAAIARVHGVALDAADVQTPDAIVATARGAGLSARSLQVSLDRLATIRCPAIARHEDGSFFVLESVSADGFSVRTSPDVAPVLISHESMTERWSGAIIEIGRVPFEEAAPRRGRSVLWLVIATVPILAAAIWWFLPEAPVSAHGRIVSVVRAQPVRAEQAGSVRRVLVRAGDAVRAGDVLAEIEPPPAPAESNEALLSARLEAARSDALLAAVTLGAPPELRALPEIDPARRRTEERLLRAQFDELRGRTAEIDQRGTRALAERDAEGVEIERIEAGIAATRQRAEEARALFEKGFISRNAYLERDAKRLADERELDMRRARIVEHEAAIARAEREKQALASELKARIAAERAEAEKRIAELERATEAATKARPLVEVRAAADGVVAEVLASGAVTPGASLLTITPADQGAEAELVLEPRIARRVAIGQRAALAIDGVPGSLRAAVRAIDGADGNVRVRLTIEPDARLARIAEGAVVRADLDSNRR